MNRLKALREERGMKQSELGRLLNVKDAAISKYESGKIPLTGDTLIELSKIFGVSIDYLLGNEDGVKSSFGYSGEDEDAVSFPHKLANQMEYNGTKIRDLANELGVPDETIANWLSGTDKSYSAFYQKLSDYFKVQIRYWTSPHAVSPGIEPNTDEYLLLLLYREYKKTGLLNNNYGTLDYYFPGIKIVPDSHAVKFVSSFNNLNEDNRDIIIGEMKKYLKEQRNEASVAAETEKKVVGK